jgi:ssDNA-binding replication factor A large subunit
MDLETIIQKIEEKTGLERKDIEIKILEKQKELSHLVSKEGAAYIVAKELGLNLVPKVKEKRRLEIKNIVPRVRNLTLSGRVVKVFEPREFERKGGKGKVASIILGDSTGTIRLSLWDEQTEIAEKLKPGMAIETFGAYTRDNGFGGVELRLGEKGGIRILKESDLPSLEEIKEKFEKGIRRKSISELRLNDIAEVRAAIVQLFETNVFFEICPECGARVNKVNDKFVCKEHGKVEPEKTIVLSGVIDDGTMNMRAVFFRDIALQLIGMDMKTVLDHDGSIFDIIDVLGKEFVMRGRVRKNKLFNRLEFIVNDVKEVNVRDEINKIINKLTSNV